MNLLKVAKTYYNHGSELISLMLQSQMEISHVAIVAENTDYMYESTGSQLVAPEKNYRRPGVVLTKISEKRTPLFYVRIENK